MIAVSLGAGKFARPPAWEVFTYFTHWVLHDSIRVPNTGKPMPSTSLPAHEATRPSAAHLPAMIVNKGTAEKTGKKRILIVDDKVSDTLLVKLCLEETNDYVVREENNARTALATAEEFRPHLILLDVRMPGVDGGELAALFQANPNLKAVPIVFLTALVTKNEIAAGAGRVGKFPILAKPIILPELVACLKQQLGG